PGPAHVGQVEVVGVDAHAPAGGGPLHPAAEGLGQQLVAEADPGHGDAAGDDGPHEVLGGRDPRLVVVDRGGRTGQHVGGEVGGVDGEGPGGRIQGRQLDPVGVDEAFE